MSLAKHAFRCSLKFWITEPAQEAYSDRDRIGLLGREHQGRQIEAAAKHIA